MVKERMIRLIFDLKSFRFSIVRLIKMKCELCKEELEVTGGNESVVMMLHLKLVHNLDKKVYLKTRAFENVKM